MNTDANEKYIDLNLPETGYKVRMNRYLNTGQSRALQLLMLQGSKVNVEKTGLDDIPAGAFLQMQDKAAELLIKEVRDKEGNIINFSPDWLGELPISDGNLIYEKINEITQQSTLSVENKKK